MDASASGRRRIGTLGTTAPASRRSGGSGASEVAPSEAVRPIGGSAHPDHDAPRHEDDASRRRHAEPFAIPTPPHLLLQAVDAASGRVLWQIPSDAIAQLHREVRAASRSAGPASLVPGLAVGAETQGGGSGILRRLGSEAYSNHDEAVEQQPGKISKTV